MDFYNTFRRFLGLPRHKDNETLPDKREDFQDNAVDEYERFGFNVFSNPLEMHRYFEHQMNEMIKSFGMFNNDAPFFGNNDESFFGNSKDSLFNSPFSFGFSQFPDGSEFKPNEGGEQNLRDKFLKNGYINPNNHLQNKTDSDLDNEFKASDLDKMLLPKGTQTPKTRNFVFGHTMTSKMIRQPDGSIETHRTVQDGDGTQEVTITRKHGDKEYTIITRTDKNGVSEVTENLINLDESQKDSFLKNNNTPLRILDKATDESIFRKLFQK